MQSDLNFPVATSIMQPKVLEKALKRADVAIGALRAKGEEHHVLFLMKWFKK